LLTIIENAKKIISRYCSRGGFTFDISVTFSLAESINLLRQFEKKGETERKGEKKK